MQGALSAQALSGLIASIYDCAIDPGRWPDALSRIHAELDFANAGMSLIDAKTDELLLNVMVGPDPDWIERSHRYGADAIALWGGWESLRALPTAEPALLSRVRDRRHWASNRYAAEWGFPQGLHDALMIILANDTGTFGSVAFGRHRSMGEVGALEIEAMGLLVPHFQRAAAISRLLEHRSIVSSTFDAALDTLVVAVALVDEDLRIVHANAAARSLLASGRPVGSRRGVLRIRPAAMEAALAVAVREAADDEAATGRRGFGIPASAGGGVGHALHVLPLRHGALRPGLMPGAVAAVFVAPAAAPVPPPTEVLAALYDLTAAEARVFAQIAAGRTRDEAASALGIAPATVKAHLAQIFAKTDTRRQADLVGLAAAIALPLRT